MSSEQLIDTIKGDLPLSSLRREETEVRIPCGTCRTTSYYLGDELVKQDQKILVTRGIEIAGDTGRVA